MSKFSRKGFTLPEILIVVGIIVLLGTILLTVISKAVDAGRRTTCLNNLRGIAAGLMAYTNDNRGAFPGGAMGAPPPPPAPAVPTDDGARPDDWIWWQGFRLDKIGQGGIGPYLKLTSSPGDLAALRCPADDLARIKLAWAGGRYPFSYVLNATMSSDHNTGGAFIARTVSDVKDAPQKILVYEEDQRMMEDGNGDLLPKGSKDGLATELISIRHSGVKMASDVLNNGSTIPGMPRVPSLGAAGNAAFCDGHAGPMTRGEAHSRLHFAPDSGIPPWGNSVP